LFVCSGNNRYEDSPIVPSQGHSLIKAGLDLDYFFIKGRGVNGYIKNFFLLKRHLRTYAYDIIHAHYSLSGFIASLAVRKNIVVSLMGSDVHQHGLYRLLIKLFIRYRWSALIVKSEEMKRLIGNDSAYVIPNGVDISKFYPISQLEAKKRVGFEDNSKNVIFVGNPKRPEKNFKLAEESFALLKDENIKLNVISQLPHNKLSDYMNAADVLLLTSHYEGSPNVIKEAMACNCPIVATDVGDIKVVIGDTNGCFLTTSSPHDVANKIRLVLADYKRTNGKKRIIELGLDSAVIARKIIELYKSIEGKNKASLKRPKSVSDSGLFF